MRRSGAPSAQRGSGGANAPPLAAAAAAALASDAAHADAENVAPPSAANEAAVPPPKRALAPPLVAPFKRRAFDAPAALGGGRGGGGLVVAKATGVSAGAARAGAGVAAAATAATSTSTSYYAVLYCKRSNKKRANKSFADGFLEVKGDAGCTLFDAEGKVVSRTRLKGMADAPEGATGETGQWEFEVVERVAEAAWKSGAVFLAGGGVVGPTATTATAAAQPRRLPVPVTGFKRVLPGGVPAPPPPPPRPLHDPSAPGAIVLNAAAAAAGTQVPVVLDPFLARRLRPHQVDAVRFLWGRVTAPPSEGRAGGVLADEMGLGKTLSTIATLYTMLKQGPAGRPLASRAVVACPASLVGNWQAEFKKWLGLERLQCTVVRPGADPSSDINAWKAAAKAPVLIASYEALRKLKGELAGTAHVLVCDEAHRIKSATANETQKSLLALGAPRVILLTGTPLQNNLGELWATLEFVAPGLLGPLATFQRVFAAPIAASRDADASADARALGATRAAELAARIATVVLRRTSSVLKASLPPLDTCDVFCGLPPAQEAAYRAALAAGDVARLLGGGPVAATAGVLPLIARLRALCVAPALASKVDDDGGTVGRAPLPPAAELVASSGKLTVLDALLRSIAAAGERVVVASTSTTVLDAVAAIARAAGLTTARIDGKTPAAARQDVVDAFNRPGGAAVMLLSARAGGAGLNLVGAARLIMCDLDWNPAVNAQACARIWRDGQKAARCVVYRLHATGTLDEKLFQRVLFKQGLAHALEAGGGDGDRGPSRHAGGGSRGRDPAFTRDELRALFSLDTATACGTRDLALQALERGGGGGDGDSVESSGWAEPAPPGWDAALDAAAATGCVTWARVADGRADVVVEDEGDGSDGAAVGGGADAAAAAIDDGSPADDETALEVE